MNTAQSRNLWFINPSSISLNNYSDEAITCHRCEVPPNSARIGSGTSIGALGLICTYLDPYNKFNQLYILDNWNKFKSFIYIWLFVYDLINKAICSECTDFCLQLCFSEKRGKNPHETFHILKMRTLFEREPYFEKV